MFALFDNGQVDIELEANTSVLLNDGDNGKIETLPKTVREKPKIVVLRWLMAGIAASITLLLVFYLGRSTAEQPPLVAEKTVGTSPHPSKGGESQTEHGAITPTVTTEQTVVAQVTKQPTPQTTKRPTPQTTKRPTPQTTKQPTPQTTESLADCIARLEAEMENLDDSVSSAQVEKLIAADARLQQMVNRIVGKQVEQAINEIQNDSTANYLSF